MLCIQVKLALFSCRTHTYLMKLQCMICLDVAELMSTSEFSYPDGAMVLSIAGRCGQPPKQSCLSSHGSSSVGKHTCT